MISVFTASVGNATLAPPSFPADTALPVSNGDDGRSFDAEGATAVKSDIDVCPTGGIARRDPPFTASGDVSIANLSRLLNGTWVRRLTIRGAPIQTNSYLYFDISNARVGRGWALMIDHVNQGWDRSAVGRAVASRQVDMTPPIDLKPATTGVLWSVALRSAADGGGPLGATLALAGDYRGTGDDYPRGGFRFTESGTFYRAGGRYVTPRGWRAPPQASDPPPNEAPTVTVGPIASNAEYHVIIDAGAVVRTRGSAGGSLRSPTGVGRSRPTIIFANCGEGVIDRYEKLSSGTPSVAGKSLTAAWADAVSSGVFRGAPTR